MYNAGLIATYLLNEVNDLLLGGVAGDELVDVGHDVHADVASQLVSSLREGGGAEDEEGEAEVDEHVGRFAARGSGGS